MKNPQIAEAHVLDRMTYLLEEGSVRHLAQRDINFGDFVDQLYGNLHDRAEVLRQNRAVA